MTLAIHLLGTPSVQRNGVPARPPRGRKPWALLAYFLLAERPLTRREAAGLLFAEADDPLGALRWNLAALRRLLGDPQLLRGELLELRLPPATYVDVHVLARGSFAEGLNVPGLGRDLLEAMDFPTAPAFELWLLTQRRRLAAAAEAALREAALARLAAGRADDAVSLATRLVALNPYEENFHELLIRAHVASDDRAAAQEQLRRCAELFRRELGAEPGPALREAARAPGFPAPPVPSGSTAARAQLDAGEAAVASGALDPGLRSLRGAAAAAERAGDLVLKAQALTALGHALVHAARGRDEEGAAALHEAIAIADATRDPDIGAAARRELSFVEVFRGRYERALRWLDGAAALGAGDDAVRAGIQSLFGICSTDLGRHPEAIERLRSAAALAEAAGEPHELALALGFLGRARLLAGEDGPARSDLERSMEIARMAWTAFLPLPEAFLAEIELRAGDVDAARERFEHAFALSVELNDPCWEGIAGRGIGLCEAAEGRFDRAIERLDDASTRCVRLPDAYLWVKGYCLDALCSIGIERGAPGVSDWVAELERVAGRAGMKELLARAHLHRAALGDPSALEAARLIAAEIAGGPLPGLLATALEKRPAG